jgi:uncharacterized oxidoreductase
MKTTNNTVLITGGSAGIGLEIARAFSEQGNHVIITGRNEERLQKAAAPLNQVTAIALDVTSSEDIAALVGRLEQDFPQLNIVINNAGQAYAYQLAEEAGAAAKAKHEMETNFFAILDLNERLLPLLKKQPEAAIVNVSSIVAFVPSHGVSTYSASKAALHSYTQSLRHTLAQSSTVKVFELMPPLVNTEFSKEIGGEKGIPAAQVAAELMEALSKDQYEIHVGGTADMFHLYHADPAGAFQAMNTGSVPA